jgi:hypothetical protein
VVADTGKHAIRVVMPGSAVRTLGRQREAGFAGGKGASCAVGKKKKWTSGGGGGGSRKNEVGGKHLSKPHCQNWMADTLTKLKKQCGDEHEYLLHPNGRWVLLQRRFSKPLSPKPSFTTEVSKPCCLAFPIAELGLHAGAQGARAQTN